MDAKDLPLEPPSAWNNGGNNGDSALILESLEELDFLDQELCTEGQGYLFGRPGPVSDFPTAFDPPVVVRLQRRKA